jgi:hypothetical protein
MACSSQSLPHSFLLPLHPRSGTDERHQFLITLCTVIYVINACFPGLDQNDHVRLSLHLRLCCTENSFRDEAVLGKGALVWMPYSMFIQGWFGFYFIVGTFGFTPGYPWT